MKKRLESRGISSKSPFFVCFAVLFGFAYSLAKQLWNKDCVSVTMWEVCSAALGCFLILELAWLFITKEKWQIGVRKIYGLKTYRIFFLTIFAVDMLCLCTYFPGVGMNDGLNILFFEMEASKQYPVFYCAYLYLLKKIGEVYGTLQISIVIYSLIQVVIVSAICAWIVWWFWNKAVPNFIKYIVALYFILEPLLAMYAIAMLRDTLFSLLLCVTALFLYDLFVEKKEVQGCSFWVVLCVILTGIMYLRNNGCYIIFPIMILMVLACKKYRKQMLKVFLSCSVMLCISNCVMAFVQEEELFSEVVGIPLQQISAVVANDGELREEQEEFISHLMPLGEIKEHYNPYTADPIKWNKEFDRDYLSEHKTEFLIHWANMLPANLKMYVKAYLQATLWFWSPYQNREPQLCFYTIETVYDNTWLIGFLEDSGIHDQQILPDSLSRVLRNWFTLAEKYMREGVCFWILLAILLLSILKFRSLVHLWLYVPILLCWLTIMISTPISYSFRYVLVFAYGLPVFTGLLFVRNDLHHVCVNEEKKNENVSCGI